MPNAAGTMMETWLLRNTCHGWVRTSVGWHHPCSFQLTVPRSQKRGPQWAETTEGKAWLEKKAEKKAKQKEIQAKIRLTLNRESFVSAFDLGFFEDLSGMCEDLRPMHQKI